MKFKILKFEWLCNEIEIKSFVPIFQKCIFLDKAR